MFTSPVIIRNISSKDEAHSKANCYIEKIGHQKNQGRLAVKWRNPRLYMH